MEEMPPSLSLFLGLMAAGLILTIYFLGDTP